MESSSNAARRHAHQITPYGRHHVERAGRYGNNDAASARIDKKLRQFIQRFLHEHGQRAFQAERTYPAGQVSCQFPRHIRRRRGKTANSGKPLKLAQRNPFIPMHENHDRTSFRSFLPIVEHQALDHCMFVDAEPEGGLTRSSALCIVLVHTPGGDSRLFQYFQGCGHFAAVFHAVLLRLLTACQYLSTKIRRQILTCRFFFHILSTE